MVNHILLKLQMKIFPYVKSSPFSFPLDPFTKRSPNPHGSTLLFLLKSLSLSIPAALET